MSKTKNKHLKKYLIISVLALAILLFVFKDLLVPVAPRNGTVPSTSQQLTQVDGPVFRHDGNLQFTRNDSIISEIKIEIVQNIHDRAQGLMYRKQMNQNEGMLFIFETSELQSFWMKNTFISLDIIYVDENLNIVTIQKYTTPFSENPIPSTKAAMYVVEVLAGYSDTFQLREGDKIQFSRLS